MIHSVDPDLMLHSMASDLSVCYMLWCVSQMMCIKCLNNLKLYEYLLLTGKVSLVPCKSEVSRINREITEEIFKFWKMV